MGAEDDQNVGQRGDEPLTDGTGAMGSTDAPTSATPPGSTGRQSQARGGSGNRINYTFRPAKYVERKMMVDVFRRLPRAFGSLGAYRYVGFGSFYFRDFFLFHKELGIENMVSIEADEDAEKRFQFNRPSKHVQIRFGPSNEVLPLLPRGEKTIYWLDYDYALDQSVLTDVQTVCGQAEPGSVLIISVNANPYKLTAPQVRAGVRLEEERLRRLREQMGADNVPLEVAAIELPRDRWKWWTAVAYRSIIMARINAVLADRNAPRREALRMRYRQLFNFHYQDGAQMLTVGGILHTQADTGSVNGCYFEELGHVSSDDTAINIQVPLLTYREVRFLESELPLPDPAEIESRTGIPADEIDIFRKVYRYFPAFMETDV